MSTRQRWQVDLDSAEKRRAAAAVRQLEVEKARIRAEKAEAARREALAITRERERLARERAERSAAIQRNVQAKAAAYERTANRELGRQSQQLAQEQDALSALTDRAQAAGIRLDQLESHLEASRQELETARTELQEAMSCLQSLEQKTERLENDVRASLARASEVLGSLERTAAASLETADTLAGAEASGRAFAASQAELESRLHQLEAEIRFVTQREDLMPAAMVTLQAMKENGYRLQDTISRDGLIFYFQKEGAAHWLAVRLNPEKSQTEGTARWDALAETFYLPLEDESCLEEMEDFETALETRGKVRRQGSRVYPRDDRQAVLPPPPGTNKKKPGQVAEPTRNLERA